MVNRKPLWRVDDQSVTAKKTLKAIGATLGFEAKLWQAADALRNNMDAAEYKHVVLGLIFLKYISDAFEAKHAELDAQRGEGADPEDPDEYRAENIFWVPPEARWSYLKGAAPQPTIGQIVDDAMAAIERDNPSLKSVLPKDYARPGLDKQRLGQLINLVSDIGLGSPADRARDILGRVYEYFLSQFASAEGKKGGQFYTPTHVVRVLVAMLAPYKGRVYDPCCGSGGMFVQSEKFIEAHSGRIGDISIYGQESNYTTWRLAKMNLAIRGIDAQIAHGDSFHNDQHPDLKADYVLANPPFNDSDWRGELLRNDKRWVFGTPPAGNANFAWVQHFIHHLAPNGTAGFVLANGSMSSNQSGEGEIRKAIVEADLVDCMVALPGQLFYATQIPVCLWFLARDKRNGRFRDRRGETLFIDARKLGSMDIKFISPSFHERLRNSALSPGDVVIVRTGKPGACTVIPSSLPVANCSDLVIVRCGQELDPYFLAYYVNSIAAQHVDAYLVGAVQQHFNVGSARKILLDLPTLAEQRAIVRILSALDDNIELNRRMNETLEAMARALFRSWFVDFDPVRAKAEGRDPGLPKPIADLFPARLVNSGTRRDSGGVGGGHGWRRGRTPASRCSARPNRTGHSLHRTRTHAEALHRLV